MTNNNDELDEILVYSAKHAGLWTKDMELQQTVYVDVASLKQALINWRDKAVREARILELKELRTLVIGLGNYMEIEVVIEKQLAHLAQLRNEDKDDN